MGSAGQLTSSPRVAPEIKAAAEKAAAADSRTLANWAELVLTQELRKQGYLKKWYRGAEGPVPLDHGLCQDSRPNCRPNRWAI